MKLDQIKGEKIVLCALHESAFTDYFLMFSTDIKSVLHVTSLQAEHDFLLSQIDDMRRGKGLFYCIYLSHQLIGAIAIRNKDRYAGQLYGWLHEAHRSKCFYQEAVMLIAHTYFTLTQELIISAHVDCDNIISYKAHKKAGFADTGISQGPYGKQFELILRNKIVTM